MDHNELLENPQILWNGDQRGELDAEWLANAWTEEKDFRDHITSDVVHMVEESGGFGDDWELWEIFAEALSEQQALNLYETIRDQSDRLESEWRSEFESIFEAQSDALPDSEEVDEFDPGEDDEW